MTLDLFDCVDCKVWCLIRLFRTFSWLLFHVLIRFTFIWCVTSLPGIYIYILFDIILFIHFEILGCRLCSCCEGKNGNYTWKCSKLLLYILRLAAENANHQTQLCLTMMYGGFNNILLGSFSYTFKICQTCVLPSCVWNMIVSSAQQCFKPWLLPHQIYHRCENCVWGTK